MANHDLNYRMPKGGLPSLSKGFRDAFNSLLEWVQQFKVASGTTLKVQKNSSGTAGVTVYIPGCEAGDGIEIDKGEISVRPDDASISINNDDADETKVQIYGFDEAAENSVPVKSGGAVVWQTATGSSINGLLGGAGITVTENGAGYYTISATPAEGSGGGGNGATQSLGVVTAVRYDSATHKFQAKTATILFTGRIVAQSGWQDVFTATAHSAEHSGGTT